MQLCDLDAPELLKEHQWSHEGTGMESVLPLRSCITMQGKHPASPSRRSLDWLVLQGDTQHRARINASYRSFHSLISENDSVEDALEAEFRKLAAQWRKETGMISMLHRKVLHPAYQRIIGMGKEALPLILQELEDRGGHWLWALSAISGIDAATPDQNLKQATESWLQWGRDNGYI